MEALIHRKVPNRIDSTEYHPDHNKALQSVYEHDDIFARQITPADYSGIIDYYLVNLDEVFFFTFTE